MCDPYRNVTLSHVRAHARTPGNEAADQLAKSAARDDGEAKDPMRALALASNTHRTVRDDQTSEQAGTWGGTGKGVRRWVKGETCTGLYPAVGAGGA